MFSKTDKASIINYDEKNTKRIIKHRNPMMPKEPGIFNCLMVGPTGSGKTNVLLNMIFDFLSYDKIYIYANNIDQDVYVKLKDHLDKIAELNDLEGEDIYHFGTDLKAVIPINDMDRSKTNLVIFDDFVLSKDQSIIEDFWVRGRHKNCICFYLSQTYSGIPITIRRNTRIYLIWNVSRGRDISLIHSDVAPEMDIKTFKKLFYEAVRGRYDFLYIDRYEEPNKKYRRNFDGIMGSLPVSVESLEKLKL